MHSDAFGPFAPALHLERFLSNKSEISIDKRVSNLGQVSIPDISRIPVPSGQMATDKADKARHNPLTILSVVAHGHGGFERISYTAIRIQCNDVMPT
jgi:hypothetical protein